jgi:hypothetical protein
MAGVTKLARERAKKANLHNRKLRDCRIHFSDEKNDRKEESCIFITEGDSASGSITKSRDVNTQAVFSLRGKPLNCFGLTKKVVYENEEFNLLQAALDIEDGLDTLRYNKVIVATDADVDGMHIRLLIITFFLQFFPELIKKEHVYVLQTPLFRVRNRRTKVKNKKVIAEADAKSTQKSDFITDANGNRVLNPSLPQPSNAVYPGDCMYKDLNEDGIIDGRDRMYDGYPNRPEYVFGSNWRFGWRGFNLTLNWTAATNVSRVWNADYRIPFTNSGHRGLLQYFADGCWIDNDNPWAPGREDGKLPRFTKTNYPWNSMDSTLWTVDASYLRLKSLNFGYTFSRNNFFDKLGISSLSLMFTGYNLLTFSKMKLQDPEAKSSSSSGTYPLVKTYNFAVNVTF